jgi:hypothetical protein
MTTLEMLDAIESEIARLRTEQTRLVSALENAESELRTITEVLRPPAEGGKRSKRVRKDNGPQTPGESPAASPAPEANTETVEPGCRPLGKRVALGRGLAQLRRTSARNRQDPQQRPA